MIISDHINFLALIRLSMEGNKGVYFPDMSEVYDGVLRTDISNWAKAN